MVLTAEQNLRIALLYEKAAADRLGVPPPQRTAFARKATWFRMKATIRAKKEAASALAERGANGTACLDEACLDEACLDEACLDEACLDEAWLDEARVNGAPRPNGARAYRARPNGARPNGSRANGASPGKARPGEACLDEARLKAPRRRYLSIAERIAAARAAQR